MVVVLSVAVTGCSEKDTRDILGWPQFYLEDFERVEMNWPRSEVERVAGGHGQLVSQGGNAWSMESTYTWRNRDGSGMSVGFRQERVIWKTQWGLRRDP